MRSTSVGKSGRASRKKNARASAERSPRTLPSSTILIIPQDQIVKFVRAIERAKGYVENPDKVFRHLVSEVGELDRAIFDWECLPEGEGQRLPAMVLEKKIGFEVLDIIFLACYMAAIFRIDLNKITAERMVSIAKQYGVPWPI